MKQFLTYLVIALFAVSAVSCKKDKDENEKVQLVKTITVSFWQYNEYYDFEYDAKNRITCVRGKFEGFSFENPDTLINILYSGDDLTTIERSNSSLKSTNFVREDNKITVIDERPNCGTIIELNSDGYPIKRSYWQESLNGEIYWDIKTLQYSNGNLVSIRWENDLSDLESYKYDNKKSPFYYCKTPKWFHICFIVMFEGVDYGLFRSIKNNLIEDIYRGKDEGVTHETIGTWVYEYDENGFPITGYRKVNTADADINYTFTYY